MRTTRSPTQRLSAPATATPAAHRDAPGSVPLLVLYDPTAAGHAALIHAAQHAHATGAPLTVISVTPHERVNAGCARCRQSAAIWNAEMAEVAEEDLVQAAKLIEPLGVGPADYVVGRGDRAPAVAAAARQARAGTVIVPWERSRILGLFRRRTLAARLAAQEGLSARTGPRP